MSDAIKNFVIVEVSTGYDDSATTVVLESGHGAKLPDPAVANFNLVWWNATDYPNPADDPDVEIPRVTARTTDTLTIVRPAVGNSYNGETSDNTAKNHNTAGKTYKMILAPTYKTFNDINTALGNYEHWVVGETPTGTINGTTTAFDTANAYIAGKIEVYLNGVRQKGGGNDYTETDSNTITFVTAPQTGDVLLVNYLKGGVGTGDADTVDGQHAPTGTIVGTTDTQTLTNKTLTNPTINMGDSMPSTNVRCRAYLNSAQDNISANTDTLVKLDAEDFDSGSDFNTTTHLFTAPVGGYYLIAWSVGFQNATDQKNYNAFIKVDGTTNHSFSMGNTSGTLAVRHNGVDLVYLTSGQTVGLYFRHTDTADTIDLIVGGASTRLNVHLLST